MRLTYKPLHKYVLRAGNLDAPLRDRYWLNQINLPSFRKKVWKLVESKISASISIGDDHDGK